MSQTNVIYSFISDLPAMSFYSTTSGYRLFPGLFRLADFRSSTDFYVLLSFPTRYVINLNDIAVLAALHL